MGIVLCARRISEHIERKCIRKFRNRRDRIWISRRIFVEIKKEV